MTREDAKNNIYDKVFDLCGNRETDIITETVNNCIDKIDEPYWHTEKPTDDGEYLLYIQRQHCVTGQFLGKGHYIVACRFNGDFEYFNIGKGEVEKPCIIAWHKIPPYKEQE